MYYEYKCLYRKYIYKYKKKTLALSLRSEYKGNRP